MIGSRSLLQTTALALPLALAATGARAADVLETAGQMEALDTFSNAIEAAGLEQTLSGEGPFTVFAPTNQAFARLPKPVLDELLKQEHESELIKLLGHHVVAGQELAAKDVLGSRIEVDTVSGDTLTVDGTAQAVLIVPTGLTVARVGDEMIIEREGKVISTRAIRVQDQVVRRAGDGEEPSAAAGQQRPGSGQQQAVRTATAEESDMPMSEHQQEVLESEPGQEQQQTASGDEPLPATEHQEQVLAEGELPGEEEQSYEQARVEGAPDLMREAMVVQADVQADNGVIHVIDTVLVPEDVLATLERLKGQS